MASTAFKQRMQEDGADQYFQSLGWVVNRQISELGVEVMRLTAELDETFPNYRKTDRELLKQQNSKFLSFRDVLRKLVLVSSPHLTKKRKVLNAESKIKDILLLADRPYGAYDVRQLTKLAREYYDMLVEYDIIPVAGYYEENAWNTLRKQ